ncbi:SDR family NAD(P)-dependent oxidoreductase [Marinobacter caseinilyticus]|uniref:SDR family NAD(P)-dependent oxidoreductase n=1 Tax=Marinobacter caseinilyticus TaxID=2692195 RepID=UPI0014075362|nr:SDR family NAD(P)-dependent oxidoreductase [Marinobacter caseinilyticus]
MSHHRPAPMTIWLTGATSGIGYAVAERLIADGHHLIATGRRKAPLETLAALAPDRVTLAAGDTLNKEDVATIGGTLVAHQPVQMAILNAGTCEYLDIAEFRSEVIEHNIITNVIGTARCVEAVLPSLRAARKQGLSARLVIVSSSAWWFPFGRAEGYGASKAALTYFAQSLRADLAAEGIAVSVVSPGFVKTPLTDQNDFEMPFLISSGDAANRIVDGLNKGRSEIQFPKRFTWTLKVIGALPQSLIDRMAASMTRKQHQQQEHHE